VIREIIDKAFPPKGGKQPAGGCKQPSAFQLREQLDGERLPVHVAIIMDGNGRWAQGRGLPRVFGHREGMEALQAVVRLSSNLGIKVLTVFAFSTENWKRPKEEIDILMNLLCEYVQKKLDELHRQHVRIRVIGHIEELPRRAQRELERCQAVTANNNGLLLNIALNYGGRLEIVDAVRNLAAKVGSGVLKPDAIDETLFEENLYTAGLPDPDLLIRPAGDLRISNFLLWQIAYTEFWSTPVFWPDFKDEVHFLSALVAFQNRERRYGGLL
jgi:undecaprenyl diphosphate synthase